MRGACRTQTARKASAGLRVIRDYLNNWKEHIPSLKDFIGEAFSQDDAETMRQELTEITPNDFYVEITALAVGEKA